MTRRTLWLCNISMMSIALGTSIVPVYLTTFGETFGTLTETDLGRIPAALFTGTFLGIILSGPLADRMGAKGFVVGGLVLSIAGLLALANASSYPMLLIACGGLGLGGGVLDMIISPIVSTLAANQRVAAMNRLHAFYCIGVVTIVGLMSAAVHFDVNWRLAVGLLTIGPGLLLIGFLPIKLPSLVQESSERFGIRKLLRQPRFWIALLMIALIGATEEGMGQWLPAYAELELGFSRAQGGLALAGFAVIMAVTRLLAPFAEARIGGYGLLIVSGFGSSLFFILGATLSSPIAALVACILVGFSCSVLWPTQLGVTADRFPFGGPSMFAMLAAAGNLGNIIAPWSEGIIAERHDLSTALMTASIFPFMVGVLAIGVQVADRRHDVLG
jgi:fucose permease